MPTAKRRIETGYYSRKAIDESLSVTDCQKSGTDYIDIRLAEVMLNYAEAAVGVGKTNEAFDMLKQIRKRAGINETSSNPEMKGRVYGLNPNMNQTEMREAVREERFIELLFEQKTFMGYAPLDDLRQIDERARQTPCLSDEQAGR